MAFSIETLNNPGLNLAATIQQLVDGSFMQYWDKTIPGFRTNSSFTDKKLPLTAGAAEDAGTYNTSVLLDPVFGPAYTGFVFVRVHDTDNHNRVIDGFASYVFEGSDGVPEPSS